MKQELENILPIVKDKNQNASLQNAINIGVPSMKNEEWKYTYYNKILQQGFTPATQFERKEIAKEFVEAHSISKNKLVFVDGIFHDELSVLINHPKINFWNQNNSSEINSNNFLIELNNALSVNGIFLEIGDQLIGDELIEIFYINTNTSNIINIKNRIKIGKNVQAKFAEYFLNYETQATYINTVTEIDIAEHALVEWYKIQDAGDTSNITDNLLVIQAKNSICNCTTLTFTGKIIRNVSQFDVNGERAETHMNGLYLLLNEEHVDNRTLVNHNVANCESFELYKGILGGKSTGVFNGKIVVAQAAQKTNAFQSNRNILLSNDANIYTKPQLEIFADDVKCSHGATSSQIEDSELFYLQARGIGKETARSLLVFAFGEEVIDRINYTPLKEKLEKRIAELLKIEL